MTKPIDKQQKYIDIIKEIDENFSIMKSMRPLPKSGIEHFVSEFGISVTHSSNAIEGNTFTYDETKLLLEKGLAIGNHSFRENQDIIGYKKAFDFLYVALNESKAITEDFIKKLHSFVLIGEESAGEYRQIQNYVGSLTNVVYTPSAPTLVPQEMSEYVAVLREEIEQNKEDIKKENIPWTDIFNRLAKHHIEFEKIHPFIDGNGRTGRLLLTYEMIVLGLLPIDIRYEERNRYYAALKVYDDKKKYSTRETSSLEKMAKLIAESELSSMRIWNNMFSMFS